MDLSTPLFFSTTLFFTAQELPMYYLLTLDSPHGTSERTLHRDKHACLIKAVIAAYELAGLELEGDPAALSRLYQLILNRQYEEAIDFYADSVSETDIYITEFEEPPHTLDPQFLTIPDEIRLDLENQIAALAKPVSELEKQAELDAELFRQEQYQQEGVSVDALLPDEKINAELPADKTP